MIEDSLLNEEDVQKILNAAMVRSKKDYLLLYLVVKNGARLGELYGTFNKETGEWEKGLRKRDIGFQSKSLTVTQIKTKNPVRRTIQGLEDHIIDLLRQLTKTLKTDDCVFRDDSMTRDIVQQIPRKYGRRAGIKKTVSYEALRQFFIIELLRSGVDLPTVQHLAGHQEIATTSAYLKYIK